MPDEARPVFIGAIVGDRLSVFTGIEYQGEVLAVVEWLGNERLGLRKPKYVLPLARLRHQLIEDPDKRFQYFIIDPLPPSLFNGKATRQERRRHGVLPGPEVTLPAAPERKQ